MRELTSDQASLLKKVYYDDKNYFGRDKLYKLIKDESDITRRQVARWLSEQKTHQLTTKRPKQTSSRPIRATKSSILQMDLIDMTGTPYKGYKYILNVIDIFSKYVWTYALKNNRASTVKGKVESIVRAYPNFKVLQSDNGAEFQFQIPGMKHLFGQAYTPQSQGVVESYNRTLRSLLRRYTINTGKNNWSDVVSDLTKNYNNTVSFSTNAKPIDVLQNYNNEQIEELNKTKEEKFNKAYGKESVNDTVIPIGTKVRVIDKRRIKASITDKLKPFWIDKVYTVSGILKTNVKTLSRNRYKLAGLTGTYNRTQLQIVSENEQDESVKAQARVRGKRNIKMIRDLEIGVDNTNIMS